MVGTRLQSNQEQGNLEMTRSWWRKAEANDDAMGFHGQDQRKRLGGGREGLFLSGLATNPTFMLSGLGLAAWNKKAASMDYVARRSEPSESRGLAVRLFEVGICHGPAHSASACKFRQMNRCKIPSLGLCRRIPSPIDTPHHRRQHWHRIATPCPIHAPSLSASAHDTLTLFWPVSFLALPDFPLV